MNLFVLDACPDRAARMACDKHVVKMPTETAQILGYLAYRDAEIDWSSFPRRNTDGTPRPYSGIGTHRSHPCTLWAGQTLGTWAWTVQHGLALCDEYTRRYGRVHAAEAIVRWFGERSGHLEPGPLLPFVQCMPEVYLDADPVVGYRRFYRGAKAAFATWKFPSSPPSWWLDSCP